MTFVRSFELVPERAGEADAYPWSLPVVRGLERLEPDPGVTFLVGENGSGRYDDLDDVRLTRSFLDDPQRFLRHLFDDG
ncbi:MAG: hypothetical protein ACXVFT_18505 [Solirubrobacteraceae bacterium]